MPPVNRRPGRGGGIPSGPGMCAEVAGALGGAEALARQRPRLHLHEAPSANGEDPWDLTALDFRDGRTVYRCLAGEGLGYNYAPVTLDPDGTAYVGALGGLVAFTGP
jgi:hypothetical protein